MPIGSVQSEEALQQKLESEGWEVRDIRLAGECYEVDAVKSDGTRVESKSNKATLLNTADLVNGDDNDDGSNDDQGRDDHDGDNGSDSDG